MARLENVGPTFTHLTQFVVWKFAEICFAMRSSSLQKRFVLRMLS